MIALGIAVIGWVPGKFDVRGRPRTAAAVLGMTLLAVLFGYSRLPGSGSFRLSSTPNGACLTIPARSLCPYREASRRRVQARSFIDSSSAMDPRVGCSWHELDHGRRAAKRPRRPDQLHHTDGLVAVSPRNPASCLQPH